MTTWYNDSDPYCAEWLGYLTALGQLPVGEVDGRDIREVEPEDLDGYEQHHFFAGIGGWALALRLAGWPEDRPVWTGSCPCQPFSSAGKRKGAKDERHVWPHWLPLIAERRPPTIFGEQVASPLGREWLAGVRSDLEALGYAVGAADLCAASVGAPHIRQRLWWVADAAREHGRAGARRQDRTETGNGSEDGGLGDAGRTRLQERRSDEQVQRQALETQPGEAIECSSDVSRLPDASSERRQQVTRGASCDEEANGRTRWQRREPNSHHQPSGNGKDFWSAFDLIPCADGKARRVEPGTFPLAHGVPARVGRLRAYGNAIVPQVAAEFVRAFMEATR